MAKQRIISIGMEFKSPLVDTVDFGSDISLLDYDIAIWDPNKLLPEFYRFYGKRESSGYPSFSENKDRVKIHSDLARRKKEMEELLKSGKTLLIFTPQPELFYVGGALISVIHSAPIDSKFKGHNSTFTESSSGSQIAFTGNNIFRPFWEANKEYLRYRACFEAKVGLPIFSIKGTEKNVGTYIHDGKGHLIFIPVLERKTEPNGTDEERTKMESNFIESIIELVKALDEKEEDLKTPDWCSSYLLPSELEGRQKLTELERSLTILQNEIQNQQKVINQLERHKILFYGDGRHLEIEVGKIFKELGFEVTEGLPGRDDLILKYKDKIAVVEVKGVSKSAGEKHAAQLEKWVQEYYTQKDIKPKGILIINAHKDIPLEDRGELPSPSQMIPFSKNREHCLITGLQLLGLYLECSKDMALSRNPVIF